MNLLEALMLCGAWIVSFAFFGSLLKSKKHALVAALLFLPALYISLNLMSQIVTADEGQYIRRFLQMPEAQEMTKIVYQYRTTQMLLGTVFSILSPVYSMDLWPAYKAVHWAFCFLLSLAVILVVHRFYFTRALKQNAKWHTLALALTSVVVLALPVNALLFKVANYDSFGSQFALLGLLLGIAGVREGRTKLTFLGFLVSLPGALEKIAFSPYFAVCAVLFLYQSLLGDREKAPRQRILRAAASVLAVCLVPVLASFLVYCWQFLLYRRLDLLFDYVTPASLCLSLSFFVVSLVFGIQSIGDTLALPLASGYLLLCLVICLVAGVLFVLALRPRVRKATQVALPKAMALVFLAVAAIGIVSTYTNPTRIHPWAPMDEAAYPSPYDLSGNLIYHYGATSKGGAIFLNIAAHYAVVLNAIPSAVLLLFFLYALYSLFRKQASLPVCWGILGCLLLPAVFALGGQPGTVPRYYVLPINLSILLMLPDLLNQAFLHLPRFLQARRPVKVLGAALCFCLFFFEVLLYLPNTTPFSPLWSGIPKANAHVPQTGYWYAAEPMMWGEDVTIAGKRIDAIVRKEGKSTEDVVIYSNYGKDWLSNPGYPIYSAQKDRFEYIDQSFTEHAYYALSRFTLYRQEIPSFLTEVEPIDTISFRGVDSVWIYRGDQLAKPEYRVYFYEEED